MNTKEQLVFPDWQHNIVNLAATLAKHLGQRTNKVTLPLLEKALQHDYRNVVYIVIDAMGSRILQKNLPENSLLRQHQVQELTSVFPSTTTSAYTTLISAQYPAEHGWFAWSLDFGGKIVPLFKNSDWVKQKLPYQCFFANAPQDWTVYGCLPATVNNKLAVQNTVTFGNFGQMCQKVNKICHQKGGKKFVFAYFGDLDSVIHQTGTSSKSTRRLLTKIDQKLQKLTQQNPDTLFVITADHGQVDLQDIVPIYQDAAVMDCLAAPISLDPRGAAFKVKPGMTQQFVTAFQKYQDDFVLYPSKDLIAKGVFGIFRRADYQKYLGDFIAIGTATNKRLVFAAGEEFNHQQRLYCGHHTGLTLDEMLVPLILVNNRAGH